jgi:hypothetical protein
MVSIVNAKKGPSPYMECVIARKMENIDISINYVHKHKDQIIKKKQIRREDTHHILFIDILKKICKLIAYFTNNQ